MHPRHLLVLLVLLAGCEPPPPTWENDPVCRDRTFSMGGMGWTSATCRPDQDTEVDREEQNPATRVENEDRITLVKCVCRQ